MASLGWLVLVDAAKIENSQRDLQRNQCVGVVMPSPNGPEHVAEQEAPEADHALALGLGGDEPGCNDRDNHCGPLQQMQIVELGDHVGVCFLRSCVSARGSSRNPQSTNVDRE